MSNLGRKLLDKPYALWAVLFVLAPLCMVVYYAFTDTGGAFSLHSVSQIPSYLSTILLSVLYGLAATGNCLHLQSSMRKVCRRFWNAWWGSVIWIR